MEMRCCRKMLHISYKDHVTNEEVRAKIQQAIGTHEDLLTIVKRHKLQWYGHVFRSSGLAKIIIIIISIINSLTARVAGAPHMILQPVSFIFP